MFQPKNIFFAAVAAAVGLGTCLTGVAGAQTSYGFSAPVYHVGKTADIGRPDAPVQNEKLHASANRSYKVAGKRYYPLQKVADFSQEGKASWYGAAFHGRKTSSGERYDKNMMTAAHPTLPIPSYARVTNLTNGKSVVVRINDRGPFHSSRIIDVSQAAAQKLNMVRSGTARVRVEQIVPGSNGLQTADGGNRNVYADLRRFDKLKDAQNYLAAAGSHLQQTGSPQKAELVKDGDGYMVRIGPLKQTDKAERVKKDVLMAL